MSAAVDGSQARLAEPGVELGIPPRLTGRLVFHVHDGRPLAVEVALYHHRHHVVDYRWTAADGGLST